ncbi:LOW QUALITY PROTEIN: Hypothetical protein PHPALM_141 [Phytophthora palmivora]|uniref:Uncharacterized protein n=1 Tax=Phytophthora palmivora TaxID=4796 RepID=A0A2P4YVL4_9STRA|nr:LOW QUALITY PROTEIN: Hypothetical protein PHPALM_141 [Phytophthora palmivora]
MEETDEAVIPHTGVYPPLPPYLEQSLQLTHETTPRTAVFQGNDTRRQVEALDQHSAARADEQLGQVQCHQERLAEQKLECLQAQHTDKLRCWSNRKRFGTRWMRIGSIFKSSTVAESSSACGGNARTSTGTLTEAVQLHFQARCGNLEQGAAPPAEQRLLGSAVVTVAAGTNLPVLLFTGLRHLYQTLNQGNEAKFFVMSLRWKDATDTEWKNNLLSARVPENMAYKTLDREVKSLCMDVNWQDAESRLSRFMADFYEIEDRLNTEDIVQVEPKKVIRYLVETLHPPAFTAAVKALDHAVKHAIATGKKTTESLSAIPCTGIDVVETRITSDSAAEVAVVTGELLDALDKAGPELVRQILPKLSAVIGIGDKPVPVRNNWGSFIQQNVIYWVTQDCRQVGVGVLLLSRNIMDHLGYNSKKLLAETKS